MDGRLDDREATGASVALAGLAHPACLIAMLILGINDHYLKQSMPGWLTGKLSDFAGVFFFPFVVGALVGLLVPRMRDRWLRDGAIALTGLWFALAKCTELGWAGTVALARSMLGSVEIVRDPSDALALVMLVPAWRLWAALGKRPRPRKLTLVGAPALVCAVLLSLATTHPGPIGVYQLHVEGDRLHAFVRGEVYESSDGLRWEQPEEPLEPSVDQRRQANHKEVRQLDWQGTHFLINGDGRVYADAGAIDWELPEHRKRFVRNLADDFAVGPYDMVVFNDGLIVALGTEGVARREADGTWTRAGVGSAQPTPLVATNLEEVATAATPLLAVALALLVAAPLALLLLLVFAGSPRARRLALGGIGLVAGGLAILRMGVSEWVGLVAFVGMLGGLALILRAWLLVPARTRESTKLGAALALFVWIYLAIEVGYSLGWIRQWYSAPLAASLVIVAWLVCAVRLLRRGPDANLGPSPNG